LSAGSAAADRDRDRDRDEDRAVLRAVPNTRVTAPLPINGDSEGFETFVANVGSAPHSITWVLFNDSGQVLTDTFTLQPGATSRSNTAFFGQAVWHVKFVVNDGNREDIRGSFVVRRTADSVITAVVSAD
jgi:hypothetical protein